MPAITRRYGLLATAALLLPSAATAKSKEEAYGTKSRQRLDVYPQPELTAAPVILFVHGGAWALGDKTGVANFPGWAERNGFLLISVGYRLTNETDAQGEVEDLAAAVAWAKANVARYGGDPAKIFLIGHSSGAHLVSLGGVDPGYLEIVWMDRRGGPAAGMFHKAFDGKAEALSPTLVAKPGQPLPPFLILYITERPDSPPQSMALAAAIRRSGGKAVARPTSDNTHADIDRSFGKKGDPEGDMAAAFIKSGQLPTAEAFPLPKAIPTYAGQGRRGGR